MKTDKMKSKDMFLSLPIIYFIILNVYLSFGRTIIGFINLSNTLSVYIIYGSTALLILNAFRYINKRSLKYLFIFETFFVLSYGVSYVYGLLDTEVLLQYSVSTLVICVPFAILLVSIDNLSVLYRGFVVAANVNFPLLLAYFIFQGEDITYSMPATYQLLFCGVIHFNELIQKNKRNVKILFLILVLFEAVLIFIKGSRGPVLILIIFIFTKIIVNFWKDRRVMFWVAFVGAVVIVVSLNLHYFLNILDSVLSRLNIYSRNLYLLLNNSILDDSGRTELHDLALHYIQLNPIIGYGASSDYSLLGGSYVHSLYLELFLDYGIVLGLFIFGYISFESIRTLFLKPGVYKNLRLIFISLGYVMLMFSSTYLQNIYFFLFIGLLIHQRGYERRIAKLSGGYFIND